ncbi:hypothetical protein BJY52DRAFT_724977 [Lactarius psammicola]|nr:hypothetical protein BJY52DRAFT_724977 [Lactarius psammicola]
MAAIIFAPCPRQLCEGNMSPVIEAEPPLRPPTGTPRSPGCQPGHTQTLHAQSGDDDRVALLQSSTARASAATPGPVGRLLVLHETPRNAGSRTVNIRRAVDGVVCELDPTRWFERPRFGADKRCVTTYPLVFHGVRLCVRGEYRRRDRTLSRCASALARDNRPWLSSLLLVCDLCAFMLSQAPLILVDFCSIDCNTTGRKNGGRWGRRPLMTQRQKAPCGRQLARVLHWIPAHHPEAHSDAHWATISVLGEER